MNNLLNYEELSLETKTFSQLTKDFEKISSVINQCRAIAYKIVSTIESNKLWQLKESYTQKQLEFLKTKGINSPWEYSLKDVLENLYDYFSWKSYTKFGRLVSEIDMSLASRLTEDALNRLNRNRDNAHTIIPALIILDKPIISEMDVYEIMDKVVKRQPKSLPQSKDIKVRPVSIEILEQGEIAGLKAKNKSLEKAFKESQNLCINLEKSLKDNNEKLSSYKSEALESGREVRALRNELRNKGA